MLRHDGLWLYALLGTFFYILFSPQLLWAVVRIRDGSWGTRGAAPPPPTGTGCPPTPPAGAGAGAVGLRGDNCEFEFDQVGVVATE